MRFVLALSLLVVCATASYSPDVFHTGKLHVSAAADRFHNRGEMHTKLGGPPTGLHTMADVLSQQCITAGQALFTAFVGCDAFTTTAPALFNHTKGDGKPVPGQADVAAYCQAACKADFEAKLVDFADPTKGCKASEIAMIELSPDNQAKPADQQFHFFGIIFYLRLPCVQLTKGDGTKEYCLPSFLELVSRFDKQAKPVQDDLQTVCVPCLGVFFAHLVFWAKPADLAVMGFVDLLCTRDGNAFCYLEFQAIEAMPEAVKADKIAKAIRVCGTTCFQKILVKSVLLARVFNPTDVVAIANAKKVFGQLDVICAKNSAGQFCAVVAENLDTSLAGAGTAQCNLVGNACPATCVKFASDLIAELGCCLTNIAHIEEAFGTTHNFAALQEFTTNDCKLPAWPARCPRASGNIVGKIVINNLKWAWFVERVAADKAALVEKIKADIVAQLGTSSEDAEIEVTQSTTTTQNSLGFTTLAADDNSITVSVSSGADVNGAPAAMQANSAISDGAFALTQLNAAMPYEARADVSNGVYADPSRSTLSHTAGPNGNGAAQATASFALIALLAVLAMLL